MTRTPHWRCDGCVSLTPGKRCQRTVLMPDLTRDHIFGRAPDWCPADGKPIGAGVAIHRSMPADGAILSAHLLRLANELSGADADTQRIVADAAERIAADARTKPADRQCWTMLVTRLRPTTLERTA